MIALETVRLLFREAAARCEAGVGMTQKRQKVIQHGFRKAFHYLL